MTAYKVTFPAYQFESEKMLTAKEAIKYVEIHLQNDTGIKVYKYVQGADTLHEHWEEVKA